VASKRDATSKQDATPPKIACKSGEKYLSRTLILATAQLQFQACTFWGAGAGTTVYRIEAVTVKDSSPLLPEAQRNKERLITGEKIVAYKYPDARTLPQEKIFIYDQNHHNTCESFVLGFIELDLFYAVSTPDSGGCGQ
jgi:hypothetical protein